MNLRPIGYGGVSRENIRSYGKLIGYLQVIAVLTVQSRSAENELFPVKSVIGSRISTRIGVNSFVFLALQIFSIVKVCLLKDCIHQPQLSIRSKLLKSVQPIIGGIQALSTNEEVHIREKGLLSELAVNINKTSDILQTQSRQLRKRETARANWIAGVSHDIRTPLSMVMGYAGQLESDMKLSGNNRQKAAVIVQQSKRMRNLINDLNLASKLEYNMQPLHLKTAKSDFYCPSGCS